MGNEIYKEVNEIRFLPNDKGTFPTMVDFTCFLRKTMQKRGGIYNYPNLSMRCPANTLVFFQYDGSLVASAMLLENIRGKCFDEVGMEYAGHYVFEMNTMCIFDYPITADEIRDIDPTFKTFSQCKRKMELSTLASLRELMDKHKNS